ncbi:MAG: phasin family protein [Luteimonas sp.]
MSTTRKTTKTASRTTSRRKPAPDGKSTADASQKSIGDSAQQVWLAGVGAFGRAQAEGTRMFETLVKEGLGLEKTAREFATTRADGVRSAVESSVDQTRERASDTWERLEQAFDSRLQRALVKLGVPGRDDVQALKARIDVLEKQKAGTPGATAAKKTAPARKTAAKTTSAPARKRATKKKTAARS